MARVVGENTVTLAVRSTVEGKATAEVKVVCRAIDVRLGKVCTERKKTGTGCGACSGSEGQCDDVNYIPKPVHKCVHLYVSV